MRHAVRESEMPRIAGSRVGIEGVAGRVPLLVFADDHVAFVGICFSFVVLGVRSQGLLEVGHGLGFVWVGFVVGGVVVFFGGEAELAESG